jgi:hypothetical protein
MDQHTSGERGLLEEEGWRGQAANEDIGGEEREQMVVWARTATAYRVQTTRCKLSFEKSLVSRLISLSPLPLPLHPSLRKKKE